ncbi:MAG: hypothetical protein JSS96_16650 [Bacteroidetes bacterium]|nr:hypothetical protein [Bacteroidota bacterium]
MVFLNLPGSPVPVWLIFLLPIALILLLIKGGQLLFHWLITKLSRRRRDSINSI